MQDEQVLRATNVYVWQNGMVMTFDQFGRQMPDYQGRREDVLDKVRREFPNAVVNGDCVWPRASAGVDAEGGGRDG